MAVKRPFLLRTLPPALRARAFYRWFLSSAANEKWRELFVGATLAAAPGVRLQLLATDFMHAEIAFTGMYEPRITKLVTQIACDGGVCVDVGANVGYYSLIWTSAARNGRVVAFEAAPRAIELLERNVSANDPEGRVTICPIALGSQTGTMDFDPGPADLTGWGGLTLNAGSDVIKVPVRRLDESVAGTAIDLLKIDVEGADSWVLDGASALLEAGRVRHILYEQNKPRMRDLGIPFEAAQRLLGGFGYRIRPLGPTGGDVVNWHATRA